MRTEAGIIGGVFGGLIGAALMVVLPMIIGAYIPEFFTRICNTLGGGVVFGFLAGTAIGIGLGRYLVPAAKQN